MTFKEFNYALIIVWCNFKVLGVYRGVKNFRGLVLEVLLDQWKCVDVDSLCEFTVDKSSVSHTSCYLFSEINDTSVHLDATSSSVCAEQFVWIVAVVKHFPISASQYRNRKGDGINDVAIDCTSKQYNP